MLPTSNPDQSAPDADSVDSRSPLSRIRIVLVDTLEPGNIGAAARAMKTMSLQRLTLVRPARFPHVNALKLAVSASDVLANAGVCATLAEAVAGCHHVYGVSARQRHIPLPVLSPRDCAAAAFVRAADGDIAMVFGGEEAGLSNADLMLCSQLVQIPSDPNCRSLNLAAAVQLLAYELRLASLDAGAATRATRSGAPIEDFEQVLAAADALLLGAGYYANKNRALAAEKLRRILQRAELDSGEIKMLRGVIAQLGRAAARKQP